MSHPVLTITLNPSLDKSSTVNAIVPDKKLRCKTPLFEPGGGGVNVSRALKRLGVSSLAFFTCGGQTGDLLDALLKEEQLDTLPFPVANPTRENFIVVDTSNSQQYRFGFPGDAISPGEQSEILHRLEHMSDFPGLAVISGSLPAGIAPSYIRALIQVCKKKGANVVVDTSGPALEEAVLEGVYMIKPNIGELATLTCSGELDDTLMDEAAGKLIENNNAEIVVVSLGASGAALYAAGEKVQLPAPVVKKRSTVGAGDSMVAGMVSVLVAGGTLRQVLQTGIACGSATTMAEGTGLFLKENVDHLLAQISS